MTYFDNATILEIADKAINLNLTNRRDVLMSGLHPAYLAILPSAGAPQSQLLVDLNEMNRTPEIEGGVVPLEQWLRTASFLVSTRPQAQKYFRDLADEVAQQRGQGAQDLATGTDIPASIIDTIEEKIVHVDDLLPIGFLTAAARTGGSVARLIVPSFEGGVSRTKSLSTEPLLYFGTGWLIGAKHIITNQHVINARSPGEAPASESDYVLQAEGTIVQFDYDYEDADGSAFEVAKLCMHNRTLDYAVMQLVTDPERKPLPLWDGPVQLKNDYVPVNIIQHPRGSSKQLGIRNNLAAKLTDQDLAYFTDTEGGSSGSPVCSDEWAVLALHKASTTVFGKLRFQGKETAWVNVGTRIDCIVKDLKENHGTLWSAIGAELRS